MASIKSAIKQVVIDPLLRWLYKEGMYFSTNTILGQEGAVWIDTGRPYQLYNKIPQLKAVIDRKASMFSNMELCLIETKTKKIIDDNELHKLLQNPNVIQSQNDFLKQYKQQEQVYGNQFIYKNKPSKLSTYPIALWNISPALITPEVSGKIFEQTEIDEIIKYYKYQNTSLTRIFEPEEILYSRLNDLDNPIVGKSPIESIKYPLSNIEAAYTYRNVLMRKKGALGILSNESKDSIGAVPLTDPERERVEKAYTNSYGISDEQRKVILTNASLKWQAMSYPTKDMMLFEEIDSDLITLVDTFGLNINMLSNKAATFENVKQSIIQVYQDTIIPEADQFTQSLTKFLKIKDGRRIIASYEHIPILKENKLTNMKSIDSIINWLTTAIEAKLITSEQAKTILNTELGLN